MARIRKNPTARHSFYLPNRKNTKIRLQRWYHSRNHSQNRCTTGDLCRHWPRTRRFRYKLQTPARNRFGTDSRTSSHRDSTEHRHHKPRPVHMVQPNSRCSWSHKNHRETLARTSSRKYRLKSLECRYFCCYSCLFRTDRRIRTRLRKHHFEERILGWNYKKNQLRRNWFRRLNREFEEWRFLSELIREKLIISRCAGTCFGVIDESEWWIQDVWNSISRSPICEKSTCFSFV